MPEGGTRIVTDSLAWIPADVAAANGITVVPLHVNIGDEQFTETVDLTNEQFYRRLGESKELPKTSAPSPGEFLEAYRQVATDAGAIVSGGSGKAETKIEALAQAGVRIAPTPTEIGRMVQTLVAA